jgi:hypothetical protein
MLRLRWRASLLVVSFRPILLLSLAPKRQLPPWPNILGFGDADLQHLSAFWSNPWASASIMPRKAPITGQPGRGKPMLSTMIELNYMAWSRCLYLPKHVRRHARHRASRPGPPGVSPVNSPTAALGDRRINASRLTATCSRSGPKARNGLSLARNSCTFQCFHSRVKAPDLLLRFPAIRFHCPFGFRLCTRIRFARRFSDCVNV